MAQRSVTNDTTVVPILVAVPKHYLAFMACDRKKLFACLKEVLYKSQNIKRATPTNRQDTKKNPNQTEIGAQPALGTDITSALKLLHSPSHVGVSYILQR